MPGAECKLSDEYPNGEKDTDDCNACPPTTSSTGPVSVSTMVALIVAIVLIGIAGITAFKFRPVIGGLLRGNRSSNQPAPRVTISLRETEASQTSSVVGQRREPIAVTTFRQLMRDRKIPGEDEFKRLGTADVRLNRLTKSKEAGLAANRTSNSPRNRCGTIQYFKRLRDILCVRCLHVFQIWKHMAL